MWPAELVRKPSKHGFVLVRLAAACAALACAVFAPHAQAQTTYYWSGFVSGTWNGTSGDDTNWSSTLGSRTNITTQPGSSNTVAFTMDGASNLSVRTGVSGTATVAGLLFNTANAVTLTSSTGETLRINAGGITVTSGTHVMAGAAVVTTGSVQDYFIQSGTFSVAANSQLTISGRLRTASTGGFVKSGSGTLILSGQNGNSSGFNTSTGFTVSEGVLRFTTTSLAYGLSGNRYTVSSGAAIETTAGLGAQNGILTLNGSGIDGTGALRILSGTFTSSGTGTITLASNASIGVDAGSSLTLSGSRGMDGAGELTKVGSGILVLSATSTYTGATRVSAGTLWFATTSALYNGGTSSWTDANLVVSAGATAAFNVGGAGEFDAGHVAQLAGLGTASGGFTNGSILGLDTTDAGGDFTYGTVIADPNGGANSLGLAKLGTGTLTLTANNTYTGTTTVSAGVLRLGSGGASGSVAGTIDNAAAVVFERSDAVTFAGGISGTGSVAQVGSGTLTFTANHTYTGTTTVSAGVLRLGSGGSSGSVAGTIANSAAVVFERSDAVTYAGGISGAGSVTQAGSGTLTFTGSNSYTGPTSVNAGTLQLGNGGTSGTMAAGSTVTVASGARFRLFRSDSFGFGSPLAGSGTVSLAGTGASAQSSYSINGDNSAFTGTYIVESGARFNVNGNANAVGGASSIVVQSGGQFFTNRSTSRPFTIAGNGWQESNGQLGAVRLAGNAVLSGTITLAANSRISVSVNNSGTISGPIVGGFQLELGLVNNESGIRTLTLSGSNSYSGGTLVSGSMVVNANNSSAFGSGAVTLGGTATYRTRIILDDGVNVGNALTLAANAGETGRGILEVAANESGTWSGPITISSTVAAGGQFYTGTNGSLTLAGPITSAIPTFGLRSGRLVLSGTGSSFTGLSVADGRLVLGAANTLPTTALISLGASSSLGILDLAGFDATIDGISQTGTGQVTNSAATPSVLTLSSPTSRSYAGTIGDGTGGVSLVKQGTGVLTLAGVNTFAGPTAIQQGRLSLGSTGSLASGTISTAAGAAFDVSLLSGGLLLAGNQTLAGSGTVIGSFTVANGATLSPGSSPGILSGTAGTITWGGGGNYNWQILTVAGGFGTGWDFLDSSGALVITATSGGFNINLWSLSGIGPDVNGNVSDFNANTDSKFLIAEFDGGITGWNPSAFSVNTSAFNGTGGFTNTFDGLFTVARGDTVDGGTANQIYIVYAAVPEPAGLGLAAAGLAALGVAALRRRRTAVRP